MIDLTKYCASERLRRDLTRPWSAGDYSIATDGKILLRVPRREDVAENPDAIEIDHIIELFAKAPCDGLYVALPAFESVKAGRCTSCDGNGYVVDCCHCDGDGDFECESCGHEDECPECDGFGITPTFAEDESGEKCTNCNGTGKHYENRSVEFTSTLFLAYRYALMLKELPGLRINLARTDGDDARPVPFKFDGGDGLVMTLRSAYAINVKASTIPEAAE